MKTPTPLIVTLVGLAIGFVFVIRRDSSPRVKEDKPEQIVYEMFDAQKAGQIRKYLNCFDADLRQTLDQRRRDQGNAAFQEYLRDRATPIMGIALSNKQFGSKSGTVEVEWVYKDRNEVQTVTLRKVGRVWKIARLSEAKREEQIVPYGTPAYPLGEEDDETVKSDEYEYEYLGEDDGVPSEDVGTVEPSSE